MLMNASYVIDELLEGRHNFAAPFTRKLCSALVLAHDVESQGFLTPHELEANVAPKLPGGQVDIFDV